MSLGADYADLSDKELTDLINDTCDSAHNALDIALAAIQELNTKWREVFQQIVKAAYLIKEIGDEAGYFADDVVSKNWGKYQDKIYQSIEPVMNFTDKFHDDLGELLTKVSRGSDPVPKLQLFEKALQKKFNALQRQYAKRR
jgi:DNA repair protein RadC